MEKDHRQPTHPVQAMSWFYYVGRLLTRLLLLLLTRWEVRGRENIPPGGPLLIVANHLHLADPPILGASIPRKMLFMAKEELFRSRLTVYFIRGYGAFPVHRGRLDREAIRQAERHLSRGLALAMFPEGRRARDAQLQEGFSGSAFIARRTGVPVLPVGITGSEKIRGAWWLKRPRLTVNIGRPFLPEGGGQGRAGLDRITRSIMEHIAALLPAEYGGTLKRE